MALAYVWMEDRHDMTVEPRILSREELKDSGCVFHVAQSFAYLLILWILLNTET